MEFGGDDLKGGKFLKKPIKPEETTIFGGGKFLKFSIFGGGGAGGGGGGGNSEPAPSPNNARRDQISRKGNPSLRNNQILPRGGVDWRCPRIFQYRSRGILELAGAAFFAN